MYDSFEQFASIHSITAHVDSACKNLKAMKQEADADGNVYLHVATIDALVAAIQGMKKTITSHVELIEIMKESRG